jgi:hypothetical protein
MNLIIYKEELKMHPIKVATIVGATIRYDDGTEKVIDSNLFYIVSYNQTMVGSVSLPLSMTITGEYMEILDRLREGTLVMVITNMYDRIAGAKTHHRLGIEHTKYEEHIGKTFYVSGYRRWGIPKFVPEGLPNLKENEVELDFTTVKILTPESKSDCHDME